MAEKTPVGAEPLVTVTECEIIARFASGCTKVQRGDWVGIFPQGSDKYIDFQYVRDAPQSADGSWTATLPRAKVPFGTFVVRYVRNGTNIAESAAFEVSPALSVADDDDDGFAVVETTRTRAAQDAACTSGALALDANLDHVTLAEAKEDAGPPSTSATGAVGAQEGVTEAPGGGAATADTNAAPFVDAWSPLMESAADAVALAQSPAVSLCGITDSLVAAYREGADAADYSPACSCADAEAFKAKLSAEKDALHGEKDALEAQFRVLAVETDGLRVENDTLRGEADRLRREANGLRAEVVVLQKTVDALAEAKASKEAELAVENRALRTERDALAAENCALRAARADLEAAFNDAQARMWKVEAQAGSAAAETRDRLGALDGQIVELRRLHQDAINAQRASEARADSLTKSHRALECRAEALVAELDSARRDAAEARALAEARSGDAAALTGRLARARRETDELRAALEAKEDAGPVVFDCPGCSRRLTALSRKAQTEHVEMCLALPAGTHQCPVCGLLYPPHEFETFAQHVDAHLK